MSAADFFLNGFTVLGGGFAFYLLALAFERMIWRPRREKRRRD